jgi:hypothetical protein
MNIPGLGVVTKDESSGWYYSRPFRLPLLRNAECQIVVESYDEDPRPEEMHAAIANLLRCPFSVLEAAQEHVYRYYLDANSNWRPDDEEFVNIGAQPDVWHHVQLGAEPMVTRRAYGDKAVYVSIECNCDWEPEHGLQIVLRNGEQVVKVGPFDGHLTNSDAYADNSLENVVYRQA